MDKQVYNYLVRITSIVLLLIIELAILVCCVRGLIYAPVESELFSAWFAATYGVLKAVNNTVDRLNICRVEWEQWERKHLK